MKQIVILILFYIVVVDGSFQEFRKNEENSCETIVSHKTSEQERMTSIAKQIKKITQSMLGHSKPDPQWFGNGANAVNDAKWSESNWLYSRFHFNFAEWSGGPNNFGVLRVMNDDLVQPKRGFGTHPHANAEIATYIVDGKLSHKDSMGSKESLGRGSLQFMSAASGVRHSEFNDAEDPCRFIQMWFIPRSRGGTPRYGSYAAKKADRSERLNQWQWLAGDLLNEDAVEKAHTQLNADVNLFVAEIDGETPLEFTVKSDRQAYVLCIEGAASIANSKGIELNRHEALTVQGEAKLEFTALPQQRDNDESAKPHVHLLIVEMAKQQGVDDDDE
jgi:redox-sensitive bicupin YhaK (pirin superfamily)